MSRSLWRWTFLALATLSLTLPAAAQHPTPPGIAVAPASGLQAAVEPASARIWEGRHEEIERFIRSARIDRIEDVPIGVTRPKRAFLAPGGPVASIAWKVIVPGRKGGFWESYKSEIAAYELDKLLEIGMVPVSVEKEWKHETGAAILWLTPIHPWKEMEHKPKPAHWERQVIRMKMFDNLICNKDRNAGNLMVDGAWNLYLIDHSRAFISSSELPVPMGRVDAALWERMLGLDEPMLVAALGKWVSRGDIRAILKRRDRMKLMIAKLVERSGEAAVLVR
jgi:hypothetical protein